ncbi:MAG: IS66 family transposase [Gammaproteobacteria bacterium]
MDEAWQNSLSEPLARTVLARALEDLKQARDRLNQTSANSSRPPGSMPYWDKPDPQDDELLPQAISSPEEVATDETASSPSEQQDHTTPPRKTASGNKPGKQPGAEGHGRTQKLAVIEISHRRPEVCAACGETFTDDAPEQAYTSWDTIELLPLPEGEVGLKLGVTRQVLYEVGCACRHRTRAPHEQAPPDELWGKVELGEWRLLGPRMASLLVLLTLRFRLSRAKVQALLADLFGLKISTGLIDKTIREAGRALAPLEDKIVEHIEQATLLHVDETSWPEAGKPLWLWVFVTTDTALYLIGYRDKEMIENVLTGQFQGDLMTDGYAVYRAYLNRLRCWAHLVRKLVGLAESTDQRVASVGTQMHHAFDTLKKAIYAAREAEQPLASLASANAAVMETLRQLCEQHRDDRHGPLRRVAREFLYDWDVILRPVLEPWLPLTNNEAERALRHYVIARLISHGTRSEVGSRAFALLASVIETCRRRGVSVLDFLGSAIAAARKGLALPELPEIQAVAA